MRICKFLFVFLICFTSISAYSAEVTLTVDKQTITEGDTLKLTIEYDGENAQKPDISSLQQDFQIVSQGSSSYVNFINGQITQTKQWILGLKPKKTGKITIKPIKVAGISSNYVEIEVKELSNVAYVPDSEQNINSPYFQIEQSVFPKSPYVQQQVTILVTIYDSIGLQNGIMNISENTQNDWSIIPLSDKPFVKQDVINGKKMNVATFAFAAFPQKSGELTTPQISFDGYYLKNNDIDLAEFDDFFSLGFGFQNVLNQKIPVKMRTKTEKIMIKPIPSDFSGKSWLPLTELTAEDMLSNEQTYKIGDAISRKLKIIAVGAPQNMIPQIKFTESSAFKQYPENPEIKEQIIDGNIVTTAVINTVYIPTIAGKQSLPAMEIDWFNVKTQEPEKTVIPAQDIFIEGGSSILEQRSETADNSHIPDQQSPINKIEAPSEQAIVNKAPSDSFSKNKYFYLIFLLIPLFFLILKKPKNPYRELVIKYIKKHDYKAARSSLIDWAKIKFAQSDIKNLNMIADIVQNDEFANQLAQLNKFMYSSKDEMFNSMKFIEIFKKIDKLKVNIQKHHDVLPNLYD